MEAVLRANVVAAGTSASSFLTALNKKPRYRLQGLSNQLIGPRKTPSPAPAQENFFTYILALWQFNRIPFARILPA